MQQEVGEGEQLVCALRGQEEPRVGCWEAGVQLKNHFCWYARRD